MSRSSIANKTLPPSRLPRQRGVSLVQTMVALLVFSLLMAAFARERLINATTQAGEAQGSALAEINKALGQYISTTANSQALRNGSGISGVVQATAPTVAELQALGFLNANTASTPSNGGSYQTQVVLLPAGCTGLNCNIATRVWMTNPVVDGFSGKVDINRLGALAARLGGNAGYSDPSTPGTIRGTGGWTLPNPDPSGRAGIVLAINGYGSMVDANYVRLNDTRDVNLGGNLAILNPATGVVCVQILNTGTININCDGRLNASLGTFTGPLGTVRVGATGSNYVVDTSGRIKADAGFWTAVGSVFGDNSLGVRASGSVFTIQTNTATDALAVHDSGRTGTRTSLATPLLGLSDPVTAGSSCSSAASLVPATQVTSAASTVLRSLSGGGLAICDPTSGVWAAVSRITSENTACSPNGAAAQTASGVMLLCTNGLWTSMAARFGYLVPAESWRVVHGTVVNKPSCPSSSVGSRIYFSAGNEQQAVQYVNRYATDNGTSWTLNITNGSGVGIPGDMLVVTYCQF